MSVDTCGYSTSVERYGQRVRRGWLIGLVTLVVVLAACGGDGDVATPAEPIATAPSAAAGIELPPRPRDIRIDGIDPCSLLSAQQRAELGLDGEARTRPSSTQLYGSGNQICVISVYQPRYVLVGILVVTTTGIERWTAGELDARIVPVELEGFPALVAEPRQYTQYCNVIVDIAPGQLVDVQYRDGGNSPAIPQGELCMHARSVASSVVNTLQSR